MFSCWDTAETSEVANGMAAVDLVLSTVPIVARGDDIKITASVHPVSLD